MFMEVSPDGETWASPNPKNFTFKCLQGGIERQPRNIVAIVPNKLGGTEPNRYLRVKINMSEVYVDELIVDPVAAKLAERKLIVA